MIQDGARTPPLSALSLSHGISTAPNSSLKTHLSASRSASSSPKAADEAHKPPPMGVPFPETSRARSLRRVLRALRAAPTAPVATVAARRRSIAVGVTHCAVYVAAIRCCMR